MQEEEMQHWWDRVPDMAKNLTYMGTATTIIVSAWLWLGLPIVAFTSDVTRAVQAHAADDAKMFAIMAQSTTAAKEIADKATERANTSLLQNSYTRRDLLRAEVYKLTTNKIPPGSDEEARVLAIHKQQTTDSLRDVQRNICDLTNRRECD